MFINAELVLLVLDLCTAQGRPLLIWDMRAESVSLSLYLQLLHQCPGKPFLCPCIFKMSTTMSWEDLKQILLCFCFQFRGYHIVKIHLENQQSILKIKKKSTGEGFQSQTQVHILVQPIADCKFFLTQASYLTFQCLRDFICETGSYFLTLYSLVIRIK